MITQSNSSGNNNSKIINLSLNNTKSCYQRPHIIYRMSSKSRNKIKSIKNESIWDIFGDGVVDSINEVMAEEENKNSNESVEKGNSPISSTPGEINTVDKNDRRGVVPGGELQNNLDEIFIKAMKQINIDSSIFEPKLLPFIPGLEPDIDNINII